MFPDLNENTVGHRCVVFCDTDQRFFDYQPSGHPAFDSVDMNKYDLLKEYWCPNYPPRNIAAVHFLRLGKFKRGNVTVLLYGGQTCDAGSGNPMRILATFNDEGKKIEEMPVLQYQEMDYSAQPYQVFRLCPDSIFEIVDVTRNYGFLNRQRVPTYIARAQSTWRIGLDGKFYKDKSSVEVLFRDTNPAIVDTMPAEGM